MKRPHLTLIAAVASNGAIGRSNGLLWHEAKDQQRFRHLTMGCPVIMGRKTWASLPDKFRPLPGRRNIVLTRDTHVIAAGAEVVPSFDDALKACARSARVFVIGGGEIYAWALPLADRLELTEIDADLQGDVYFPDWDRSAFTLLASEAHDGFRFATYERSTGRTDANSGAST